MDENQCQDPVAHGGADTEADKAMEPVSGSVGSWRSRHGSRQRGALVLQRVRHSLVADGPVGAVPRPTLKGPGVGFRDPGRQLGGAGRLEEAKIRTSLALRVPSLRVLSLQVLSLRVLSLRVLACSRYAAVRVPKFLRFTAFPRLSAASKPLGRDGPLSPGRLPSRQSSEPYSYPGLPGQSLPSKPGRPNSSMKWQFIGAHRGLRPEKSHPPRRHQLENGAAWAATPWRAADPAPPDSWLCGCIVAPIRVGGGATQPLAHALARGLFERSDRGRALGPGAGAWRGGVGRAAGALETLRSIPAVYCRKDSRAGPLPGCLVLSILCVPPSAVALPLSCASRTRGHVPPDARPLDRLAAGAGTRSCSRSRGTARMPGPYSGCRARTSAGWRGAALFRNPGAPLP